MELQSWLRKTIAYPLATDCVLWAKRCRWCIWTILINSHNGFYHSLVCPASPPCLQHLQRVLTASMTGINTFLLPDATSSLRSLPKTRLCWGDFQFLRQRGSCSQRNTMVSGRVLESNTWEFLQQDMWLSSLDKKEQHAISWVLLPKQLSTGRSDAKSLHPEECTSTGHFELTLAIAKTNENIYLYKSKHSNKQKYQWNKLFLGATDHTITGRWKTTLKPQD